MRQKMVINGLGGEVESNPVLVQELLLPSLRRLTPRPGESRAIAMLAGPPGTGKSTLAQLIHQFSTEDGGEVIDVVGMDGFHYPQSYLDSHHVTIGHERVPLASIKGAPETFDLARLDEFLQRTRTEDVAWPHYDRTVHDVVQGTTPITGRVVVVEGNWLLLEEPRWSDLLRHAAMTIFLGADPLMLRQRLIARKVAGGMPQREAEDFYEASDGPNVQRCLTTSIKNPDLRLAAMPDGTITKR